MRAEMVAAAAEMAVTEMLAAEMAEMVVTTEMTEMVATEMATNTEMAAKSSESIGRERYAAKRENCSQCNE
jgi:hypothetical protein